MFLGEKEKISKKKKQRKKQTNKQTVKNEKTKKRKKKIHIRAGCCLAFGWKSLTYTTPSLPSSSSLSSSSPLSTLAFNWTYTASPICEGICKTIFDLEVGSFENSLTCQCLRFFFAFFFILPFIYLFIYLLFFFFFFLTSVRNLNWIFAKTKRGLFLP